MNIFGYNELEKAPGGGVIALGFFDGVHQAHRQILKTALSEAKAKNLPFGVFTFYSESGIKSSAKRLYTTEERLEMISELGVDFAVVADFEEIKNLSADDFVKTVLINGLDAAIAVAGYNFRFGKGASGNGDILTELMKSHGREALILREIRMDGRELSATLIRGLIEKGEMKEANRLLGVPYYFTGEIEHGRSDGKRLGFPTVNTGVADNRILPKLGVYRSLFSCEGRIFDAVTNIGSCPTLGKREIHLETHIINFDENVYGKKAKIYLLDFLREEKAFSSEKELIMQINIDKNTTIARNGEEKWQELGLK